MITIVGQQIISRPHKFLAGFAYHGFDLGFRLEGEALQDVAAECAARGLEFGARVVDASCIAPVVAAEGVFAAVYYDARVEEGAAEGPEEGGQFAWL